MIDLFVRFNNVEHYIRKLMWVGRRRHDIIHGRIEKGWFQFRRVGLAAPQCCLGFEERVLV